MKVLDASFPINDYHGHPATKEFYDANGGEEARWVIPVPAYAELLVGEGNLPNGDVESTRSTLVWAETHAVDEHTAVLAGKIADEIPADGPYLDGPDAMIAAVGHELDAPVVSRDGDLTHEATTGVVDVEEYLD